MKITTLIMTVFLLQVSAATKAQITLNAKKASLQTVLESISTQSGYDFVYSDNDLKNTKPVNVKLENVSIDKALQACFEGQPLIYEIADKTVMVKRKEDKTVIEKVKDFLALIDVHGRVVDENGQPLQGVTVKLKDQSKVTVTDKDGIFLLNKINDKAVIIISYIGYLTKEVDVASDLGTIALELSDSKLDEVQIQAYGITSKRLSVGNISSVKAVDIEKAPTTNPLLSIQGRIPGVFIEQSTGTVNGAVKIRIQGANSLFQGSEPFYVIDGVPYASQLLPSLTSELNGGSPLSFINPSDIESIDVLKDADATSIYGSRASNGAILITTKKGKVGQTTVNLNVQQGWGKVDRYLQLLNTSQYLEMRREAFKNDGVDLANPAPPWDSNVFKAYLYPDLAYFDQNRYTDWQKTFIGGTAAYTNAEGSISGGNTNIQYLFSGNYNRQTTVTPADLGDKKGSFHFNLNGTSTNKKFKFTFSGEYLADANKLAQVTSLVTNAFSLAPNAPSLYNPDGSLNFPSDSDGNIYFFNPLSSLKTKYINNTKNLIANSLLSYEFLHGLVLKSNFGYSELRSDEVSTNPIEFYPESVRQFSTRTAKFNTTNIKTWIIEPQITFNHDIGQGQLEALIGSTFQENNYNRLLLNASGYISDVQLENIKAATSVTVDNASDASIISKYRYNALFGRLNYNWEDKYIFSVTARRDGSSRFGDKNKFNTFYSAGGAWLFSNESFVKNNLNFLSFGKLKTSYGTTGSDQIPNYSYLNLYGISRTGGTNYQNIIGLEPTNGFPNPYIQWEETKKISASLDLGFINDRILFSTTIYRNRSSNQLYYDFLPSITGGNVVNENIKANIQNKGWEFSLNTQNIKTNNFSWTSGVNLTIQRNKLLSYGGPANKDNVVGQPVGVQRVFRFLGVNPETGIYQFADGNGQPTSNPNFDTDRILNVDLNPAFYGGFQNSFTYKNITLDFLFQFVKQRGQNNYFGLNGLPGVSFNQPTTVLDRWQKPGDVKNIQMYSNGITTSLNDQFFFANYSDKAYSDASYIRLKNLSLSWQIPEVWRNKMHIQNARIYMQGQNLLTLTNYPGLDPENRGFAALPPLKVLTLGIQLTL